MDPSELRGQAYRYRAIARTIIDARAVQALSDLADEYDARAARGKTRPEAENDDDVKACCRSGDQPSSGARSLLLSNLAGDPQAQPSDVIERC